MSEHGTTYLKTEPIDPRDDRPAVIAALDELDEKKDSLDLWGEAERDAEAAVEVVRELRGDDHLVAELVSGAIGQGDLAGAAAVAVQEVSLRGDHPNTARIAVRNIPVIELGTALIAKEGLEEIGDEMMPPEVDEDGWMYAAPYQELAQAVRDDETEQPPENPESSSVDIVRHKIAFLLGELSSQSPWVEMDPAKEAELLATAHDTAKRIAEMEDSPERTELLHLCDRAQSVRLNNLHDKYKRAVISGLIEGSPTQEAAVEFYARGSGQNEEYYYQSSDRFQNLLMQGSLLDDDGLTRLEDLLSRDNSPSMSVVCTYLDIDQFPPATQDMIVELSIFQNDDYGVQLIDRMTREQQLGYFANLTRRRSVVDAWAKAPIDSLLLSVDELAELARAHNNQEMMVLMGANGLEGCDPVAWAREAVVERAAEAKENGWDYGLDKMIQTLQDKVTLDPSMHDSIEQILREYYATARKEDVPALILRGSYHQPSPFLELLRAEGVSYVELCQRMYDQADAAAFKYTDITELVAWSGQQSKEVASQLVDVMLSVDRAAAVGTLLSTMREANIVDRDRLVSPGAKDSFSMTKGVSEVFGDMTDDDLVRRIASSGHVIELARAYMEDYPFVARWIERGGAAEVIRELEREDLQSADYKEIIDFVSANEMMIKSIDFGEETAVILRTLREAQSCMAICGVTKEGYRLVKELRSGVLSEEASRFGITRTGVKGIEQFRVAAKNAAMAVQEVNMTQETLAQIAASPLYQSIVSRVYRADEGEYMDEGYVAGFVRYFDEHGSEIAGLSPEFQPRSFTVDRNRESPAETELTVDVMERLQVFATDIITVESGGGKDAIAAELRTRLGDELARVERRLASIDAGEDAQYESLDDKKKDFYRKNQEDRRNGIENASSLLGEQDVEFKDLFQQLHSVDACKDALRRLAVAEGLAKLSEEARRELMATGVGDVTIQDVLVMKEYVTSLLQQYPFDDKKASKAFGSLMSPRAFASMLDRYDTGNAKSDSMQIDFIPTRGLAMELSGYVGDACWANQYESIASQFPNITSVIFKRTSDNPANQRLIGSMLLIETTDADGRGVLIMRGINPIENQINKMDTASFLRAAEDYCRAMAEAKGLVPALVLDDHSAGAATNRPALFEQMELACATYPELALSDDPGAVFNGYNLNGMTKQLIGVESS